MFLGIHEFLDVEFIYMKKYPFIFVLGLVFLMGAGCTGVGNQSSAPPAKTTENTTKPVPSTPLEAKTTMTNREFSGVLSDEEITNKQIKLTTSKGVIVFELFPKTAPKAVSNFVSLANDGFYNGLKFHRREEGFVIQGGDPLGTGYGGPGYRFEDELTDGYTYERGIVAMANSGPNTNGSQFFIMLDNVPLPKLYTIFGRVTQGIEIIDQIKVGDLMTEVKVEELSVPEVEDTKDSN